MAEWVQHKTGNVRMGLEFESKGFAKFSSIFSQNEQMTPAYDLDYSNTGEPEWVKQMNTFTM